MNVSGTITIDQAAASFNDATVYVRLENVSYADAPARLVAERVIANIDHLSGSAISIPFSVTIREVDERASYNLRVLVDLDRDGTVSPGDYITTRAYPVLTHGNPTQVDILVDRV